jgi:hypothetical protein
MVMDVPDHPTTAPSMAAVKREKNRESMFLLVTVRFEGIRDPISARVRNISVGGMMIDSTVIRKKGHRIVAELKNIGEVTGHVAWSTELALLQRPQPLLRQSSGAVLGSICANRRFQPFCAHALPFLSGAVLLLRVLQLSSFRDRDCDQLPIGWLLPDQPLFQRPLPARLRHPARFAPNSRL